MDTSCFLVYLIEKDLFNSCKISLLLVMFFRFLLSVSLILCQIDRFLALYLNAEYNNYFNLGISIKICILRYVTFSTTYIIQKRQKGLYYNLSFLSTTVCLLISIFTSFINPGILECKHSIGHPYAYFLTTQKANVYFSDIPKLMAGLVVIIVSIYVLSVLKRLSNAVLPINLTNPQEIERCLEKIAFPSYSNTYSRSRVKEKVELKVSTISGAKGYFVNAGPSQPDTKSKFNLSGIEV